MKRLANQTVVGAYRVQHFLKEGFRRDSYVVKDAEERRYIMKLFDLSTAPDHPNDHEPVMEVQACRQVNHPRISAYVSDGEVMLDGIGYPYLIMSYREGTLLSDELRSGHIYTPKEARAVIVPVLEGLVALHAAGYCHNNLTTDHILLEKTEEGLAATKIIGLGHINKPAKTGIAPFPVIDLNPSYMAPEALRGIFDEQSDVFAVSAILYTMLTGHAPWPCSSVESDGFLARKRRVQAARQQKLEEPAGLEEEDPIMMEALLSGLAPHSKRPTASRLLGMFRTANDAPRKKEQKKEEMKVSVEIKRNTHGGGFADVAGMEALKRTLNERVIWVLSDKEKAAKYRISPPNGMLLYGPPGCGKTFFAQKFAEESHFNYMLVNGSDLGSTYIHGTQGKIANLFKEAQSKAPTVICFDEFDAFVPKRGSREAEHKSEEINEFLSQLNNCAERGVFVIGTTNRADIIDPAVLRKGRLDFHFEIPAPDHETRAAMFQLHLKCRPLNNDIDTARLAGMTAGYASSDIAFIVNEAAIKAALDDEPIAQKHLEETVSHTQLSPVPQKEKRRRIGY